MYAQDHQPTDGPIWLTLFRDQPEILVPHLGTIFDEGVPAQFVYVVTSGAVIELKGEKSHEGHLVSLCRYGDVFGIRALSTLTPMHSVRAIALTRARVLVMHRDVFMGHVMQNPDLFIALSVSLSKRQHFAQSLQDSCSGASLREHVEYVLNSIATAYGMDREHSSVAVPEALLVELVGCPQRLLDTYIQKLVLDGTIDVDKEGVRLRVG